MGKKPRLPRGVLAVISDLQRGEVLCKSQRLLDSGNMEIKFWLNPSGRKVTNRSAERAITTEHLVANGDGLFGDDTSPVGSPSS